MPYKPTKNSTALLIVDAQEEYFNPNCALYTSNAESIRENLVSLRQSFAQSGKPTIFIQHVHRESGADVGRMGDFDETPVFVEGTTGVQIIQDLAVKEGDLVVKKSRYSAFTNTELNSLLNTLGIDTVIVAGLMTNYCSVTTARHAHDLDYKVIFVSDANAGPDMPDLGFGETSHADILQATLTSLAGGVAAILSTNEITDSLK